MLGIIRLEKSSHGPPTFSTKHHPDYLHYSAGFGCSFITRSHNRLLNIINPNNAWQQPNASKSADVIERDLSQLCVLLRATRPGFNASAVPVSNMVGVRRQSSGIDLVCYRRLFFINAERLPVN